MKTPEKMMVYNLFPLLAGPFSRWTQHFGRIRDMGFNWLFVNPIQRPGMSGSIYSIKDHFEINPALLDPNGEEARQQIRAVVESARAHGLRVMIDLVINHCSIDSPLMKEHPNWFEWDQEGEVVHPYAMEGRKKVVWGDLARFDYRDSVDPMGLQSYWVGLIRHLADLGFEGLRCDAAYQVPADRWKMLIGESKNTYPHLLFAAETLGCTPAQTARLVHAGFDYIFNSSKWWDYESHWLLNQHHLTRDVAPSVGFPESHDTERLCEELEGNLAGMKQRYLFTALFSAGIMMPVGFEFGFRKKLHVVETTPRDWEQTGIDLTAFIRKVNGIKEEHEIFQEESANQVFAEGNPHVLVMWKGSSRTGREALLLLNKDVHRAQIFETQDIHDFFESKAPITDVSPENRFGEVPAKLSVDLAPGEGRVLIPEAEET